MAKRKQRVEEVRELTRKETRMRARDRERQRRLYIGAGIAIGLALLLVIIGAVLQFAIRPNRAIASVGDQQIITRDFWQRMRFEHWQLQNQLFQMQQLEAQFGQSIFGAQISQIQSTLANPFGLGVQVLDQMIDDEIIKREAAARGITVSEEEIDEVLRQEVANSRGALTEPQATETAVAGVDATATAASWTPTPAPTLDVSSTITATATALPTPEPLATRPIISETGYSEGVEILSRNLSSGARSSLEEYRELIRMRLLSEKLQEAVTADTVSTTEEQIHARHILIPVTEVAAASSDPITTTTPVTDLADLNAGEALTETEAITATEAVTEAAELAEDESAAGADEEDATAETATITATETVSEVAPITTTDAITATDSLSVTTPITTSEGISETVTTDPTTPRSDAEALALAEEIHQRLLDGEDFAKLAALYSSDTSNNLNGGDLGWFGRGMMVPEFEEAAFGLAADEISEPIKTQFGYHIIQVVERDDERPKDENQLLQEQFTAFQAWLQEQKNGIEIERPTDLASLLPPEFN